LPKTNKGKSATIKDRAIYVYLPTEVLTQDWKNKAEKAGISISKFVFDRVEDSIKKEEGEGGYLSRLDLVTRLKNQSEELRRINEDNRMLKKLVENQELELKRFRSKPFIEEKFEGTRSFDKELVDLLKSGKSFSDDDILYALNINPTETGIVKAVAAQLEILQSYDLIVFLGGHWKWKS
jgi:hypothetical protein